MRHSAHPAGRPWQVSLIVALFTIAVAGAAAAGWWYARESPPHQGPLLLISVEGLGATALPVYGATDSDTPSIDALAADAVVFERAYTHSPLTLPAHVSILAGQLPFEHGVRDEAGFTLKDDARSLAELLRNRGFETGAAVSSFLLRRESGVAQGFSFFDAELPVSSGGPAPVVERDGARTIDAAERWLRARSGQRFFLFVQVDRHSADEAVRRLVGELEARGLYDDATILLTADRGSVDGAATFGEASLRVPLLVKQPRSVGAGRRVAAPVQHIDLLPTILDLVRAPIPSGLRGRSLRAVLDSETGRLAAQPIYAESLAPRFRFGGRGVFALASPDVRYVRTDREEIVGLAEEAPSAAIETSEVEPLRSELDELLEGRAVAAPEEIPAATEDEYAALGYLGGGLVAGPVPPDLGPEDEAQLVAAHREAAALVGQKRYAAAVERLRVIARAHPALAVVQYQLGMVLDRAGRVAEATAAFESARTLVPDNPYVPVALARLFLRASLPAEAARYASLAVALGDRLDARARSAAHEVAALVALASEDAERALEHARATEEANPEIPMSAYVRGRLLYDEGDYAGARTAFEEAWDVLDEHDRQLKDLHWHLGDTLARLDRYREAEEQFRQELQAFPRNIRSYSSLAMLYRATGRRQAVDEIIGDLIVTVPTPDGYATAARLWTILGDRTRAQALRADARRRFRDDPSLVLLDRSARAH